MLRFYSMKRTDLSKGSQLELLEDEVSPASSQQSEGTFREERINEVNSDLLSVH